MTMLLCIYFLCVVLNTATDSPDQKISDTMVNLDTENQDKKNSQKKEFEVRKFNACKLQVYMDDIGQL